MADTVCKSKGVALAALDTIAGTMPRGTQKDVLIAIKKWIDENVNDVYLPEELQKKIEKIFRGTEEEQKGRAWIDKELEDPAYVPGFPHKMIHEPEHRAELVCRWNAKTKKWEPVCSWPPVAQKQAYDPKEDKDG